MASESLPRIPIVNAFGLPKDIFDHISECDKCKKGRRVSNNDKCTVIEEILASHVPIKGGNKRRAREGLLGRMAKFRCVYKVKREELCKSQKDVQSLESHFEGLREISPTTSEGGREFDVYVLPEDLGRSDPVRLSRSLSFSLINTHNTNRCT